MATDPNALSPWESAGRTGGHARDTGLEDTLRSLNDHLQRSRGLLERPAAPRMPVLFIVGCARGGSTLTMQWLAATGLVAYPTNILSRFYKDPYVGALVHRALFDLDKRGEIFPEKRGADAFTSDLGRTRGADAPHDFNYFWRNYFAFGERQDILLQQPDPARLNDLRSDVAAMELVFGKPMLLKAMEMNWQIPTLRSLFPDSVFLFVQRNIVDNAVSLLNARRSFYGDEGAWYSYKPMEYGTIKDEAPWEQVVAQVWYTNRTIKNALAELPERDVMHVQYERFCHDPSSLYASLADRLTSTEPYSGPASFEPMGGNGNAELVGRAEAMIGRLVQR